ncbi:MAG: hypothetical protein P4L22_06410 [Candidatus Babeliales bacterium]|nr:hypothetical protein [Candidatus Babeliales bacterium]
MNPFIILALLFNFYSVLADKNSMVSKTEEHFLSNFTWECDSLHVDKDWSFNEFLTNATNLQRNLKPITKTTTVFDLLDESKKYNLPPESNLIIDTIVWDDLSLFRNLKNKKALNFAQRIDRTYTTLGKISFNIMLAQSTNDLDILLKRQEILKTIINNPTLYTFLDAKFTELQKYENLFLSFYSNDPLQEVIENQYINFNKDLNKSEISLGIKNTLDHQKRIVLFLAKAIATVALPIYGISKILDQNRNNNFTLLSERLISSGDALLGLTSIIDNNQIQGAAALFAGMHAATSAKSDFESIVDNFAVLKYLQEKLIHANSFLTIASEISKKLVEYPVIYNTLDVAKIVTNTKEVQTLLELLKTNTFTGSPSIFSNWGKILKTFKMFNDLKSEFTVMLSVLGQIEAFTSVAKLYKEYETKNVKYSFAKFSEAKTPFIALENFWNPIIDESKVVTNSISFGLNDDARNIVITGTNRGGKSTITRSIALNIILAQTFGIAPASSINLTIFNKLGTYMNITDDISEGHSLYEAQANRITFLMNEIKPLKHNQFWFMLLDEPLNGTKESFAQALSYSIAKNFAKYDNNLCLLSTHFPKLSELEAESKNFANYKVVAQIDADNKITYDYLLSKGSSDQNLSIEILQSKDFDNTILNDARELIKAG